MKTESKHDPSQVEILAGDVGSVWLSLWRRSTPSSYRGTVYVERQEVALGHRSRWSVIRRVDRVLVGPRESEPGAPRGFKI